VPRRFIDQYLPLRWLAVAFIVGAAGASVPTRASPSTPPSAASSSEPLLARDIDLGHRDREILLVGTAMQLIVAVDPRSESRARDLALAVNVVPAYIATHGDDIIFGGWLERYDVRRRVLLEFAYSDAYTISSGIAVSPGGTLFASNGWLAAGGGPPTGSDTSVVAFPDAAGQNPAGAIAYLFGPVDDPKSGNGPLTVRQIGFKSDGKLLATSATGYGIYEAAVPPASSATCGVTMCSGGTLDFVQLVQDPSFSTIRFGTDGHRKLFVLHRSGSIDEDDLATGTFQRIFVANMIADPVDMAVSEEGDVFVLEQSGVIKGFSSSGTLIASLLLPPDDGPPLSIAFCCHFRR
jgi:hypothetical protein